MIEKKQLMEVLAEAGRAVGVKEILRAVGGSPRERQALERLLTTLVKSGQLERDGKRYVVPGARGPRAGPAWGGRSPQAVRAHFGRTQTPKGPRGAAGARPKVLEGTISHHRDGFAFFRPLGAQNRADDIFIPPEEAAHALDRDQVRVELTPGHDGRAIGRVVEVLNRTRQQVVGVYFEQAGRAWVEPRESNVGRIRVPPTQLARPGDAVKVRLGVGAKLLEPGRSLVGEVSGSLGNPSDASVEVLAIAFSRGFSDEFPAEVMDEADALPVAISQADATSDGRRDLRDLELVTIDGEDARDFDDAIFVGPHARGWRLVVAIADVSHYVREGSALDAEAVRRGTSVYLPGRVLPMLPERLSNGLCSLRPDVDRLCLAVDLVIGPDGEAVSADFYPGVMRSHARCTYEEVHRVLAGESVPGRDVFAPHFARAQALSRALQAMRRARGAIGFDLSERRVELGPDGLPVRIAERQHLESHGIIESCMLAANEAVARYFRERGLPTINRFHGPPDEERLGIFLNLLHAYGVETPRDGLSSKGLNAVLTRLEGHPEQRALNQLALRAMMQAVYSAEESGHFGLGADDYLHFTSPIRRYPDLAVHRLLKASWARGGRRQKGEAEVARLEALAVQCSERERGAMQVERDVNQHYACLLVKDHIGEAFKGTVTGLTENGFFVELSGLFVDGFVPGESVAPSFEFDEATYRLVFGDGTVMKIGQEVEVTLSGVNLQRRQIELALQSSGAAGDGPTRSGKPALRQKGARRGDASAPSVRRSGGRPERDFGRAEKGRGAQTSGGKPGRDAAPGRRRGEASNAAGGKAGPGRGGADARGTSKARDAGAESRLAGWRRAKRGDGRSAQPPPQPWNAPEKAGADAGPPRARDEDVEKGQAGFDARAVLDRLWRQRGGNGGGGKGGGPKR